MSIYAASVDTGEKASEVAAELSYPLGQGVSREIADSLGAWWEDRRGIIQPTQFLLRRDGSIVQSTYSDGPLGRLDAADVCGLVNFLISQKQGGF
ncbi:MAG: peroxiredoxin [Gammaproteobacteria bacterium]